MSTLATSLEQDKTLNAMADELFGLVGDKFIPVKSGPFVGFVFPHVIGYKGTLYLPFGGVDHDKIEVINFKTEKLEPILNCDRQRYFSGFLKKFFISTIPEAGSFVDLFSKNDRAYNVALKFRELVDAYVLPF